MDKTKTKMSRYQVIPAALLARYERPVLRLRWERSKMKNTKCYRLFKNENFVGFKREVTEYLPAAASRWQLDPFPHDENDTQSLSKPAMGIATLGREKITSGKQRRVTHPESKMHTEPNPGTGCDGLPSMAEEDFPPMPKVKPPKKDNG